MHDLVVEAGKLMIESKIWPAKEIPKALAGRLKMSRTKSGAFRMAELTVPDGRRFLLLECNPAKVGVDRQGNGPKDKVMVKQIGKEEWVGQVRRLPFWHFHSFVPLGNKTDELREREKTAVNAAPRNASAKAVTIGAKKMIKQIAAPVKTSTLKSAGSQL